MRGGRGEGKPAVGKGPGCFWECTCSRLRGEVEVRHSALRLLPLLGEDVMPTAAAAILLTERRGQEQDSPEPCLAAWAPALISTLFLLSQTKKKPSLWFSYFGLNVLSPFQSKHLCSITCLDQLSPNYFWNIGNKCFYKRKVSFNDICIYIFCFNKNVPTLRPLGHDRRALSRCSWGPPGSPF